MKTDIGPARVKRLFIAYYELATTLKHLKEQITPEIQCHLLIWVSHQLYPKIKNSTRQSLVHACWILLRGAN